MLYNHKLTYYFRIVAELVSFMFHQENVMLSYKDHTFCQEVFLSNIAHVYQPFHEFFFLQTFITCVVSCKKKKNAET